MFLICERQNLVFVREYENYYCLKILKICRKVMNFNLIGYVRYKLIRFILFFLFRNVGIFDQCYIKGLFMFLMKYFLIYNFLCYIYYSRQMKI